MSMLRGTALLAIFTWLGSATILNSRSAALRERELEHKRSMATIMGNMTLDSALNAVRVGGSASPELVSLVQSLSSKGKHLRAKTLGVDKARDMLNSMLKEVQDKYEIESQKCCTYHEKQTTLIEQCRQDISDYNAEAAEARKEIMEAQAEVDMCKKKLPETKDALKTHEEQCKDEEKSLRDQIAVLAADIEIMGKILEMTQCSKSMFLLKCEDECSGESYTTLDQDELHTAMMQLQANASRQLLDDTLSELDNDGFANTTKNVLNMSTPVTIARRTPCKRPKYTDKRTSKCSIKSTPQCENLQEKFLLIQTGVIDKHDSLMSDLKHLLEKCSEMKRVLFL
jgi:hypothetical protein